MRETPILQIYNVIFEVNIELVLDDLIYRTGK